MIAVCKPQKLLYNPPMKRVSGKIKLLLMLLVLAVLLQLHPSPADEQPLAAPAQSAFITAGIQRTPFLPADESSTARLISSIRQQGLLPRTGDGTVFLVFFALLSMPGLPSAHLTRIFLRRFPFSDQAAQSLIRYIQTQSDRE